MYEGLSNLHLMSAARNYNAWMFDSIRRYVGQRVLEIGAGIGTFTEFLADREHITATDLDPACLAELSGRFSDAGNISIRPLDLNDIHPEHMEELRKERLDSIVCLNVLEHIEDDVKAIRTMRSMINQGRLLLVVPAFQCLYGVEDKAVGHYRRYGKSEIVKKLHSGGWRPEKIRYFNSLGAMLWFLSNRVLKRAPTTHGNVLIYDKIIVPVLSRIEGRLPIPFGQSLVVIGKS